MLRVQAFDFSNVCSFCMEPGSAVQLYSAILPQVKHVHKFVLNTYAFSLPFLDRIMRWINLFVVGGLVSKKLYHAVD
jgi:hypothetical protein